jgi:hypothetical protein
MTMGQKTRRDYVFEVTISYDGDAPKPDAHAIRRHVVDALQGSRFPNYLYEMENDAALEDNAVTIQVRCTGEDCREPLPRHGN